MKNLRESSVKVTDKPDVKKVLRLEREERRVSSLVASSVIRENHKKNLLSQRLNRGSLIDNTFAS